MITLTPVGATTWRAVAALEVDSEFAQQPLHYLALCAYGGRWHPLAALENGEVVGFCMWALEEDTCWLGGILIDRRHQGRGLGRQLVVGALGLPYQKFALSYEPGNIVAEKLYKSLGFVATGEMEDTEMVARLAR